MLRTFNSVVVTVRINGEVGERGASTKRIIKISNMLEEKSQERKEKKV